VSSRVFVALRVAVPQARAFDVFVNHIGDWWEPNGLFRTAPGKAGRLAFEGDAPQRLMERPEHGEPFEIGRVLTWEPPERLVFSWHQADFPAELKTEVEVRFVAVADDVTRVSVEHRGFHRVPADSAARHGFPDAALQLRLAEWWQKLLVKLDRHSRQSSVNS
jgi:uncharacterized protein YndB with AHSA1/START domain